MTFQRIQQLISYLPSSSLYFRDVLNYTPQINAVNKFLCAYKDLSFGFHFVKSLVQDNIQLPASITEEFLIQAYNFEKYGLDRNQDLIFAISITHPANKNLEDSIKAFLISDAPYEDLQAATGISKTVLKIYEQLFFNVRDRKQEALFIANIVYPDTRMVEVMDNYIKNEDSGRLLMRSAYNNGLEDAAYFSGLKMDSLMTSGVAAVDMATKLEASIMTNGYFLARNGFLNSRAGSTGITHARNILIASKQSGQDATNTDMEGLVSLEDSAIDMLKSIKGPSMEVMAQSIIRLETEKQEKEEAKKLENAKEEEAIRKQLMNFPK